MSLLKRCSQNSDYAMLDRPHEKIVIARHEADEIVFWALEPSLTDFHCSDQGFTIGTVEDGKMTVLLTNGQQIIWSNEDGGFAGYMKMHHAEKVKKALWERSTRRVRAVMQSAETLVNGVHAQTIS